ncbi:CotH kinase family protein [uncultured Lactobacillus sp.]|uniref:CotH kinase family protein n=1 Tax=uncultured Lactobacillus sp. TaxID=153152 RepID=UPI002607ABC9|nr:CotH kinase family protein [uncultured Lactobacillus sp.]
MNNMPTINNGGQPYYFPADIAKEGEDYARLSNFFKTRVGDNGKILTLKWYDQGRVMNVHGFIPFIQGMVGKHYEEPDTKEIVMAPDALYREWQGSADNGHDGGFMDYTLEDQMFPQEGIFKGHFGLKDTNGNVLTSVNIVFEVLGNDLRVGETSKYYSAELDRLAREYEVKTDQMVANGTQKVDQFVAQTKNDINASLQTSRDNLDALNGEIRANRAEQANISQHLAGTQQQIANYDIVTRPEFQNGMDTMNSAINSRLSQMKTNPIAVANAGELTTNYPNGADGIFITADTGHKWVYLYGAWKDCGEYQAIGIENSELAPLKEQLQKQESKINQNTNDIGLNSLGIKDNTTRIQNIEGAGHLMDILLIDDAGNYITDDYGNRIGGYKWLPLTDTSLTQAGLPADGQAVGAAIKNATTFKPEKYGIPTLYLWGNNILSLKDKSKTLKNEVTYSFPTYGVSGTVEKFKVQGASSVAWPKKNYTLNLDKDFEVFRNYGKNHKYVIKANYAEPSQALNIVGAKLWGRIRDTHKHADTGILNINGDQLVDNNGNRVIAETDPQLSIGGNYGAVDGFPIAVYINNQYWGLYSFAIPKDDWMAKMPKKSKGKYAIVDTIWDPQGAFKKETNFKDQMELQFCSTKDSQWAMDSVNELIRAVMASYDSVDNFNQAVSPLVDLDSAIDYYIFSVLVDNDDGIFRNYLLQTFDGKKWYFAAYDLDSIFGRTPDFWEHLLAKSDTDDWRDHGVTFENITNSNRLFYQLWKFYKDEILKRTKSLIEGVMSESAVDTAFVDYVRYIPLNAYNAELEKWPGMQNTSVDNINRIGRWYMQRIAWLRNKYFNN